MSHAAVFRSFQARFLAIPQVPLCYRLQGPLLHLAGASPSRFGHFCEALEGLGRRDDSRFVRYSWEVGEMPGYTLLAKGWGYSKWDGLYSFAVAWGENGERIKAFNSQLLAKGRKTIPRGRNKMLCGE